MIEKKSLIMKLLLRDCIFMIEVLIPMMMLDGGEPDFQPQPNGPKPNKIDYTLPEHILAFFNRDEIEINYMAGKMVNYNYPEDFSTMFSLDTHIKIVPTIQSDGIL